MSKRRWKQQRETDRRLGRLAKSGRNCTQKRLPLRLCERNIATRIHGFVDRGSFLGQCLVVLQDASARWLFLNRHTSGSKSFSAFLPDEIFRASLSRFLFRFEQTINAQETWVCCLIISVECRGLFEGQCSGTLSDRVMMTGAFPRKWLDGGLRRSPGTGCTFTFFFSHSADVRV